MSAAWIGMVVVQVAVTLVLGLIVGSLRWTMMRLIAQNDRDHGRTDQRIEALTTALAAERDARHAARTDTERALADIREDRPRRDEVIGQYAALVQRIGDVAERLSELSGRIDGRSRGGQP
jgi:uncharacterized membrane-anchored protein YhcB (DUF1043 family)